MLEALGQSDSLKTKSEVAEGEERHKASVSHLCLWEKENIELLATFAGNTWLVHGVDRKSVV